MAWASTISPGINGEQVEVKDEDGGEGTKKNKVIVSKEIIEACISKKSLLYDKNGEEHYNLISASLLDTQVTS